MRGAIKTHPFVLTSTLAVTDSGMMSKYSVLPIVLSFMSFVSVARAEGDSPAQDIAQPKAAEQPPEPPATGAKDTKDQKEDGADKPTLQDDLKSGKLIQFGLTGGVAAAWHLPLSPTTAKLTSSDVSAMPYVALMPFYFRKADVTRAYCAARFFGKGPQEAADIYARKLAFERYKIVKSRPAHDLVGREKKMNEQLKKLPSSADGLSYDDIRFATGDSDGEKGWELGKPAVCWDTSFGLYVGVPTAFDTDTKLGNVEKQRGAKPLVSGGLAIAPSAYFSLLLGFTFSNVKADDTKDASGNVTAYGLNELVVSPVIALGGNLDLASFLLGIAK
jgi:hypothetical protein